MDHSANLGGDGQPPHHPRAGDRFAGAFGGGARRGSGSPHSAMRSPADGSQDAGNTPGTSSGPASPVVAGPSHGAAVAGLNPRSCVTCRRRKVKCDKRQPCSNCQKAAIDCVFPRPGRAPRKAKKPPDAELLARLRRLEGVVQKLGKGATGDEIAAAVADAAAADDPAEPADGRRSSAAAAASDLAGEAPSLSNPRHNPRLGDTSSSTFNGRLRIEKEMGALVVGEGKSRYVSNTFWASLTEEVAEMRDMIGDPSDSESDEDESHMSPESLESGSSNAKQTHQEFLFGYSSTMITLRILHPPAKQIMTYWDIFVENVDPVIRILHRPTARHLFALAARDQGELSRSSEALVFAVYFGAVTSLSPEACQSQLGLDRDIALKRYRFATEQALARAGFMGTQELLVVQAFCLFLSCVRRHDETKAVWTMTGLLFRMATSIGLHRDGTNFNLPPFQTEMRRRLWWQVCTLDVRSSEDQGADPLVAYSFYDTRMPLNINDDDVWPDMKEPPVEHEGATEMTFDLVRYEIGGTIRVLSASQSSHKLPEGEAYASLEAKGQLLEKLRHRLEDKYLRHCDMAVPLQWVAANVARLVMAKIWLVIHHPFRRVMGGSRASEETRSRTFLTSIDVIRYSRMLETQQKTSNWGWLFRTYFQWHAVAFLLSELCIRTSGTAVDEAWEVLVEAFPDWDNMKSGHKQGMLWKPIQKLIARAKTVRIAELRRRRAFPDDGSLGPAHQEELLAAARAHVAATELTDLRECRASANLPGGSTAPMRASSSASPASQSATPHWQNLVGGAPRKGSSPANSASGASSSIFSPPARAGSTPNSRSNAPGGPRGFRMDADLAGIAMPASQGFAGTPGSGSDLGAFGLDPAMGLGAVGMDGMGMLRASGGLQGAGLQGNPVAGGSDGAVPYGQLWFDDPFLQDNDTWDIVGTDAPWADMMAGVEDDGSGGAAPGQGAAAQGMGGGFGGMGGAAGSGGGDAPMDLTSGALWGGRGGF